MAKTTEANKTLQQIIVNKVEADINAQAQTLGYDISFEGGYHIVQGGGDFKQIEKTLENKYAKVKKTFIPLQFLDFNGNQQPIPGLSAEDTTINAVALLTLKDDEGEATFYNQSLEILETYLATLTGKYEKIEGYDIAFNVSTINMLSEAQMFAGASRTLIGFSIYYKATKGGFIGNQITIKLRKEGQTNYTTIKKLDDTSSRSFTPEEDQKLGSKSAKTIAGAAT
jgi:hypothetical protein